MAEQAERNQQEWTSRTDMAGVVANPKFGPPNKDWLPQIKSLWKSLGQDPMAKHLGTAMIGTFRLAADDLNTEMSPHYQGVTNAGELIYEETPIPAAKLAAWMKLINLACADPAARSKFAPYAFHQVDPGQGGERRTAVVSRRDQIERDGTVTPIRRSG